MSRKSPRHLLPFEATRVIDSVSAHNTVTVSDSMVDISLPSLPESHDCERSHLSIRRRERLFTCLFRASQWCYLRTSAVASLPRRLQCDITLMGNEVVASDDEAALDGFVEGSVGHGN